MKKYFLAIIIFLSFKLYGQQITFQKCYIDSVNIFGVQFELIQTDDNGYLTGNVKALIKTDSLGQIKWSKQYGPNGFNSPACFFTFDKTFDGGYITTGSHNSLFKLNSNYTISWKKKFPALDLIPSAFLSIRETKDHGFIIGGEADINIPSAYFILIKTDSSGIVQWSKVYQNQIGGDAVSFMTLTADGGYMMCGWGESVIDSPSTHHDISVLKVDSMGTSQWAKHYNTYGSETFCYHITSVSDGGYVLTGSRNQDKFILKIDMLGNIIWEKLYANGNYGYSRWVEETNDHGLILTGMEPAPLYGFCTQLYKTDSIGNILWSRYLSTNSGAWGGCVKQTNDGGFAIGATISGTVYGAIDIIKTDSLGHTNGCQEDTAVMLVSNLNDTVINVAVTDSNLNLTTVVSNVTPIGSGYELIKCQTVGIEEIPQENQAIEIFPNPFIEELQVSGFGFHVGGKTSIVIYDLMGEKVYEKEFLLNKTEEELNLSFLKQGVYFLQLKNSRESYSKKIVKM